MKAFDLAHAYVDLDRFVFFQLQNDSAFVNCCDNVRKRLAQSAAGLKDFEDLCAAGAESSELLWLLDGCMGLRGFINSEQVFGWPAQQLTKGLAAIEEAASVIEKMQQNPFGILALHTPYAKRGLDKDLRSYVALARAAQSDFGHRSDWFLNIAKARLVIHTISRTNGAVRDKEISGLLAAMTDTEYGPGAQSRWRRKHGALIRDRSLDPYTIMTTAERERRRKTWEGIAAQDPEFYEMCCRFATDHAAIAKSRQRSTLYRNSAQNSP
jgi:hypothetical protein